MEKLIQRKDESRKEYLVRVAIIMLEDGADWIECVIYDDAECDASCLADDLRNEFVIEET